MRLLVTGAAGFLGRAFVGRARAAGHAVTALDRAGEVDRHCDIGDPDAVAASVAAAAPEALVHLAALLTDAAAANVVEAARVNALGTAALFAAAARAGARKIVYASSITAVGPCPEGSGDATPLRPGSVYGVTKAFGEQLGRALAAEPDFPDFVALRFGWVYGPGRVRGWRLPQAVIEAFARGEPLVRYPEFPEPIDWTYVDDAAEVLLRAVERPLPRFASFNVCGDRRRMGEAVAHLRKRFPSVRAEAVAAATPPSGWGLCNDVLEAALGFAPSTGLEAGIDRMLAALDSGA